MTTVFQGNLSEHLRFGHLLEIGATANDKAGWFSISLASDKFIEGDNVDIGLRMSVYLKEDFIVFKQKLAGEWLPSISDEFACESFRQPFKIIFVMDEKKFHISVNDEKLNFVKYALPISRLNTIKITGDLMTIKEIDHRRYFPLLWPPVRFAEERLNFSHDIPDSFQPGHVMVLTIKLLGKMKGRFHMHFRNIWNMKRQEVHVSVRFDTKQIVRTSKLPIRDEGGNPDKLEYGLEETEGIFPFDLFPMSFKLAVAFTETSLKFAKDGVFLFDYNFRTPNVLCDLSGLKILGLQGMKVRVYEIDHFHMADPLCEGFEQYSDMLYSESTEEFN